MERRRPRAMMRVMITAPRHHRSTARRRPSPRPARGPVRRRIEPHTIRILPVENWGDMRMRHRRERHEDHVRTAAALNDLDQAIRRAERWCDALDARLAAQGRRMGEAPRA